MIALRLLGAALFLFSVLSGTAALPAAPPADSHIRAALADIERYEQQAAGLSPSRKANIRRLQRMLDLVRERLQKSTHRNDPSYRQAADRLQRLDARLEALLAGNRAPAEGEEGPAPVSPVAEIGEGLAAILAELNALEAEADRLAAGDVAGANDLIRRLNALIATDRRTSDGNGAARKQAAERIRMLGSRIVATAKRQPKAAPSGASTADPEATAQQGAGLASYEVARLKRSRRNIASAAKDLGGLPSAALQRSEEVARWRKRLARLRQDLAPLAGRRDLARVAEAFAAVDELERRLEAHQERGRAQLRKLGKVEARITEIRERYVGGNKLPEPLRPPIDETPVASWARSLVTLGRRIPADLAYLEEVRANSTRVPRQELDRLIRWVGSDVPDRLKRVIDETFSAIDGHLRASLDRARGMASIDPGNAHLIRNNYLDPEVFSEAMARIEEGKRLAKLAARIREMLGQDRSAYDALYRKLVASEDRINETSRTALAESRMPEDRSNDPRLREIAVEVLKRPEYKIKGWLRLVVNRDRESYQETRGEVLGTQIRFYPVDWDEFQVTTAEEEGNRVFLWYNRLKFFRKAHRSTPRNRWILSERFRGAEILRENVER